MPSGKNIRAHSEFDPFGESTAWNHFMRRLPKMLLAGLGLLAALPQVTFASVQKIHAQILLVSGEVREGDLEAQSLALEVSGSPRSVRLADVLSIHRGAPAAPPEKQRIDEWLTAVVGDDASRTTAAGEKLVDIGLPALAAMLILQDKGDTDLRVPHLLYSLFYRIMPAGADRVDRTLDMVRMANGTVLRGRIANEDLTLMLSGGKVDVVPFPNIRRIAFRRPRIERTLSAHFLRHCKQTEWLDTGVLLAAFSRVTSDAAGIVRLSFDLDIWTATPDGLIMPKETGQKRVVDGFPFGALLARAGASGERILLGALFTQIAARPGREGACCELVQIRDLHARTWLGTGRLYLAINDNEHWQKNIGSYLVKLKVMNAYDVGTPE